MKILFYILFLLLPFYSISQQIGGVGSSNGYYSSTCSVYLSEKDTIVMANAFQWYPYSVIFTDGHNVDFTLLANTGFKYTRNQSREFTFSGTANNVSDKQATVTMQIFVNSDSIAGGNAERYFHNANTTQGFNVNRHLDLNTNDTIKVMIWTDTPNTTIYPMNVNVTILQTH